MSGSAELSIDPESLLVSGIAKGDDNSQNDDNGDNKSLAGKEDGEQTEDKGNNKESQPIIAETEGKAEFFAGVKAEAGLKAWLLWHETNPPKKGWWELGNVGLAANGSAGLSAEAEFKIGYNEHTGKFIIKAKASATLGVGCGGEVQFSVGLGGLWRFAKYVYKQIKENDFSFVDLFDDNDGDVFAVFCGWYLRLLQLEIDLVVDTTEAISNAALEIASGAQEILADLQGIQEKWDEARQEKKEVIALVKAIENESEMLKNATPEVKGRILYLLTQYRTGTAWEEILEWDYNCRSEKAAVNLITKYIVSTRDWQETFEHMAEENESGEIGRNFKGAEYRLANYPPPGTYTPNPLGIYDMSGISAEWVLDGWYGYTNEPQVNPVHKERALMTIRGFEGVGQIYALYGRGYRKPTNTGSGIGIRFVVNQKEPVDVDAVLKRLSIPPITEEEKEAFMPKNW